MLTVNSKEEYYSLIEEKDMVLVDFYADWCGPCKMMAPILAKVQESMPELTIIKVDAEENPEILKDFSITSIPTFIFYHKGIAKFEAAGFMPQPKIESMIRSVL